ncbi:MULTISPECIES: hypothetical protein [Flavobacteriaceae]|uniref:DUF3185 family protein n=2 Tax=Flavobacteriaceae TaxID=49546 RepID=A0A4Y8AQ72_9FLAO|nr:MULTISPECIES: hypothetical protein [Flavobacteriaceae]TEW72105.1 hypothetical protein E2488_14665 [Gramella jeungdoensis]GGK56434.1 hypothetical protein GCM10007963_25790 [Lutibacter litoralis]
MHTRKIIGILLIVISLCLGYFGFNKISENSKSIEVLDLKVDISNNSEKEMGYISIGSAIILLIGGLYLLKNEDK